MNRSLTKDVEWWDTPWRDVYETLGNDFAYADPLNLVIFPDNHDQSRIFTVVGEDYDLYRIAIAYYLTMRGIPQIYYGTEVLMSHPGTGSHGAIRAEFPGGWNDHKKNAFTGKDLSDLEREAQSFVKKLLNWRKTKSVIHAGQLMQFTPINNVYVYFRYDDDDTVMVIFNRGDDAVSMQMARFAERLGDSKIANDVITDNRISIESALQLEARSVMILEVE